MLGFGESRAAVRRRVCAGPASSQPPPGARLRLVPPSSRRLGLGVGGRAAADRDTAWRRKLRLPSACRSPPSPPPPLQLPRAGPSLGSAEPPAAHQLGSWARGEGRGGGRAALPTRLPPPAPHSRRGGWAGRRSPDALHHRLPFQCPAAPTGSPAHSAPSAGFLRTISSFWGS